MQHIVSIISVTPVTHDTNCIRFRKPQGYNFIPGHATDVSINKPGWENEKRPFTFTCLNSDDYLEFTIKSYQDHEGVTKQTASLQPGDELIIDDPWGAIEYKGPGYFIAGGAGITPFVAILRKLYQDGQIAGNKLFFSNKTADDIIYEKEFKKMLGDNAVFVLNTYNGDEYVQGHIDEKFLKEHVSDAHLHFYVCGPDPMIFAINGILEKLGASPETVVFEK